GCGTPRPRRCSPPRGSSSSTTPARAGRCTRCSSTCCSLFDMKALFLLLLAAPVLGAPPAPERQSVAEADAKSAGCLSCHTATDRHTMHQNPGVVLGCADCHGGDARIRIENGVKREDNAYREALQRAHIFPRNARAWPTSANPERTYTLLNRESPEFVRFVNPGDLRAARDACG